MSKSYFHQTTKMSRVKHLLQRLDDLRERERLAKLHNRELLQQFDEAQNTLREVLDHTAAMKMLRMFGERQQKNLKTNNQLLHSHDRAKMVRKTGAYQEMQTLAQTQTTVIPQKISQHNYPPSSISHELFRPPLLPPTLLQEHPTDYTGPTNYNPSHTSSPNELYTDQLMPLSPQTDMMPKQPPSCSSETSEDNSHSEDLAVKPVRLCSDQAGSKTSSRASSQRSTEKKSSQSSSSDEEQCISHKSSPSREVAIGSKTMALISESEDAKSFSNQKSNHRKGLGLKDSKNKVNSSESHSDSDKSDVDESSVKLSQLSKEAQGSEQLKKYPTLKERIQSLSEQSSLEDEDGDSEKDQTDGETSQEDGELSIQDIPGCSSTEEANRKTLISGSTSSSSTSAESATVKCDGGGDNMKVCESNQDTAFGPEDSDSDCIVSPQTGAKIIYVIPEHVVKYQDEENNRKRTSSEDEDSDSLSDEEDIEHVLIPQEQTQKQRKSKADDKSEEPYESDDFYD